MPIDENALLLEKLDEIATEEISKVAKKFNIPPSVLKRVRSTGEDTMVNEHYPYKSKMRRRLYEERKLHLQIELVKLHNWVKKSGHKVVIVFEGRDAAGKGGSIKRFMQHLNPRWSRVVALEKPTEREKGQWYFQRYVYHMPTEGEMVFFDRSWYNRAGVEKVMGFCSPEEYLSFVEQVSGFEKMLIDSGITLVKFWFSVSRKSN